MKQSARVTPNNWRSGAKLRGIVDLLGRRRAGGFAGEARDQLLEDAAAMLVIFKLIETGTSGREQNGVARLGAFAGQMDGAFERPSVFDGHSLVQVGGNFLRRGANQNHQV